MTNWARARNKYLNFGLKKGFDTVSGFFFLLTKGNCFWKRKLQTHTYTKGNSIGVISIINKTSQDWLYIINGAEIKKKIKESDTIKWVWISIITESVMCKQFCGWKGKKGRFSFCSPRSFISFPHTSLSKGEKHYRYCQPLLLPQPSSSFHLSLRAYLCLL